MSALLERSQIRQQVYPLSVAVYHELGAMGLLGEDVELLQGTLIQKMSKSPLHEFVCQKLMRVLLRAGLEGFGIRRESPLTIGDSEPEPDLSVVPGTEEDYLLEHPSSAALVIEVSISSLAVDEEKAAIYAAAGIPEYWMVCPALGDIRVHRDPTPQGYETRFALNKNERLSAVALPSVNFAISEIFPAD